MTQAKTAAKTRARKAPERTPVTPTPEGLEALGIDTGDGPVEEPSAIAMIAAQAEEGRAKLAASQAAAAAAPEPEGPPLLDLDEEEARQPVRHEGKAYEIKSLAEFGIVDQQRLSRHGPEFFKLYTSTEELSEEEEARLELLLDSMFEKVFVGPAAVKKKMADGKRASVVLNFTLARMARQIQAQIQARESDPTTGS